MSETQPDTLRREAHFTKDSIVIFGTESNAKSISKRTSDGSKHISNTNRPLRQEFVMKTGSVTMNQTFRLRKVLSSIATQLHNNMRFWENGSHQKSATTHAYALPEVHRQRFGENICSGQQKDQRHTYGNQRQADYYP
eukprot:11576135-Heterocapsa_arctica.AAC.1